MNDNQVDSDSYVDAFKKALLEIESDITEGQRKILLGHYAAHKKGLSVKKMAELAGYDGDRTGSLHYGKLALKIAEAKGEVPPYKDKISAIAKWTDDKDERGHGQWMLYDEMAEALEQLNWVTPMVPTESFDGGRDEFYEQVVAALHDVEFDRRQRLALAGKKPKKIQITTIAYVRNPDVVAEVLHRANGICETCTSPAPFNRKIDGTPYLEVHHQIRLADGGLDCVGNAIALCPNCHRRSHHGYGFDVHHSFK